MHVYFIMLEIRKLLHLPLKLEKLLYDPGSIEKKPLCIQLNIQHYYLHCVCNQKLMTEYSILKPHTSLPAPSNCVHQHASDIPMQHKISNTVATPIERQRSIKFQSLQGGVIFEFCPFLPYKCTFLGKKVAFCSRWCSNQEWRSIGADMVCIFNYNHLPHYFFFDISIGYIA